MRPEPKRYFSVRMTSEQYSLITLNKVFSLLRHNMMYCLWKPLVTYKHWWIMKYSTRQKLIPWHCVLAVLRPLYFNVPKLTTIAQEKLECTQPEIKKQIAKLSLLTTKVVDGSQPANSIWNLQNNFCQTGISINSIPGVGSHKRSLHTVVSLHQHLFSRLSIPQANQQS